MTIRKAKRRTWFKKHEETVNKFFFAFSILMILWILYMMFFHYWIITRPVVSFIGVCALFLEVVSVIGWYSEIQDARKKNKKKNH